MAIKGVGGYTAVSSVNTGQPDRRPVEIEKVTLNVQTITNTGKSVEFTQRDVSNQDNKSFIEGSAKDNKENHLKSVLSMTNEKIHRTNTRCEFQYHENTKRVSIKVIDKETDEVIREIPPEESLEMVEKMWELAGLIVDERC